MATTGTPQQMDYVSQSELLSNLFENLEAEGLSTEQGAAAAPIGNGGGAGSGVSEGGEQNAREQMPDNFVPQPPMRQQEGGNQGNGEEEYIEEYIIEEPEDTRTTGRKVYDEVKTPALVCAIFFVLSLRFLDRQMAIYMPKTVNEYRRLNIFGILSKAAVAGLLFFVLNRYVLTRF